MLNNSTLVEWTKDIVVAALSNGDKSINGLAGKEVADYTQAIYDKLVELSSKN